MRNERASKGLDAACRVLYEDHNANLTTHDIGTEADVPWMGFLTTGQGIQPRKVGIDHSPDRLDVAMTSSLDSQLRATHAAGAAQ